LAGIREKDPTVRIEAINTIWKYKRLPKVAAQAMVDALRDKDAKVRWQATNILGALQVEPSRTVPALMRAAQDEKPEVRRIATFALMRYGPPAKAAPPLMLKLLTRLVPISGSRPR
jgi:HEAT repeat protein